MPDFSALAEFYERLSGGVGFSVEEWFTCDEDDSAVSADLVLVKAESLAQDTFEAVANDGAAQPPARRETDFAFKIRIIRNVKDKVLVCYGTAFSVDFLEVAQDSSFVKFKH